MIWHSHSYTPRCRSMIFPLCDSLTFLPRSTPYLVFVSTLLIKATSIFILDFHTSFPRNIIDAMSFHPDPSTHQSYCITWPDVSSSTLDKNKSEASLWSPKYPAIRLFERSLKICIPGFVPIQLGTYWPLLLQLVSGGWGKRILSGSWASSLWELHNHPWEPVWTSQD